MALPNYSDETALPEPSPQQAELPPPQTQESPTPLVTLDQLAENSIFIDTPAKCKALGVRPSAQILKDHSVVMRSYPIDSYDGSVLEERHLLDGVSPSENDVNMPMTIVSISARFGEGMDEHQEIFESIFTTVELADGRILKLSGDPACDSIIPRMTTNLMSGKSLRELPIVAQLVRRKSKRDSKKSYYWFTRLDQSQADSGGEVKTPF